jgi:hypothetical protein
MRRSVGLDEAGVRMRQVEAEHLQLHPYAADDASHEVFVPLAAIQGSLFG